MQKVVNYLKVHWQITYIAYVFNYI